MIKHPIKQNTQLLSRLTHLVTKLYYGNLLNRLGDVDLERYFFQLLIIHDNNGRITQQQLADYIAVDKVFIVRMIDHLTAKGYVKRVQHKTDRRAYCLELTPKGEKLIPTIIAAVVDLNKEVYKGLNEYEIANFHGTLNKLITNMELLPQESVMVTYGKSKSKRHDK